MPELSRGTVLAGYRIESLIGRGGMGVVYRAVQTGLERVVALKVIAPELLDDDDVRARFLAEAHAAASVDHPNVIPVHDAGEDDGIAYIAMRFVAGDDLRSLVRRGGPLDPAEAAEIVAQAGAALDAIHRAGFVHRDVKPANLLVDADRHVYLTDFGLAKAVLTHSGGTRTGQWVGTLDYVSPEQIEGGRIDARADVYALGGVLHYALTGRVPFEREGDLAKLWAQLSAPPPVPSSLRRGLRGEFDAAVARAMAKEPEERYPSAGDLGRAARAAALGRVPSEPERVVARGAAAPGAAPSEPGLAGEAAPLTARRWPAAAKPGGSSDVAAEPRPRRVLTFAAVAGALVAAAVAVALLTRGEEPPPRAATGTATPSPSASASPAPAAAPRVAETIENVGDRPAGIALAAGDLWVTSPGQPFLTRIVAATGTERARHPKVGVDAAAIVPYGDGVWVASALARKVQRLDPGTGAVRLTIDVPGGPRRMDVDGTGVWVATESREGEPGLLLRYDARTGEQQQRLTVPEGLGGLLATPDGIFVLKRDTHMLARLEPGGEALEDVITLPGAVRSMRDAGSTIYIVFRDEDTVARVGTDGREFVTASGGHSPTQALLAGGRVFVTARNDHSVLVLDPETLLPVADPIRVGLNPAAMTADERSVWVTSLSENSVTRIDYR